MRRYSGTAGPGRFRHAVAVDDLPTVSCAAKLTPAEASGRCVHTTRCAHATGGREVVPGAGARACVDGGGHNLGKATIKR